jgi:hypothetical protein
MVVDTWGPWFLLLGNEDLGNAVGGKRVNLKDFGYMRASHTATVCLNLRWHYGQDHTNRKRLTRRGVRAERWEDVN